MFIHKLHLTNYKNHEKKIFSFKEKMNAFVGLNGAGKTNILDAIYFLCIGKSYFSSYDKHCIKHDEGFFRLQTDIETTGNNDIVLTYELGKRKKIKVNDIPLSKAADHIGHFPIVVVAPNDNVLILGGAAERRKFIDLSISQINRTYLENLIKYNNVLSQRNALLKQIEKKGLNKSLLAIYNEDLISYAKLIFDERKLFIKKIEQFFNESFQYLSAKNEGFSIQYKSDLLEYGLGDLLDNSLQKDIILKRTTKGIHKDDLVFNMGDELLKDFGSQGQQKTFLLALKLTQFNFLKAQLNKVPLFIIDDIFDKLDSKRSQNLVKFLAKQRGQVFISNTDSHIFQNIIDVPMQLIEVENEGE